jgi:predicted MFS family arabinose efflux permease
MATTINLAVFTDSLPPGRARQRALGYYMAGIAVGYSLGAFLAGFIADWYGTTPAFLLAAGFGAVALLGVPPRAPRMAAVAAPDEPFRLGMLWHRRLLAVVVVAFTLSMAFMFWNTYLPLYGLAIGLTLGQVGTVRAAFGLCQVVARPLSGGVVERVGATRMTVFGLAIQTLGLMVVPLTDSLAVLLVVFVAHGSARALAIVANAVEVVEGAEDAGVPRGVMAGIYNTAMDLGNLAGPALGGLAASVVGLSGSFVLVPLIGLVGCVAAVVGSRPRATPPPRPLP